MAMSSNVLEKKKQNMDHCCCSCTVIKCLQDLAVQLVFGNDSSEVFSSFSAKVNRCNSLPRISEFRLLEWISKISTLKKINMSNFNDMTVILGELAL